MILPVLAWVLSIAKIIAQSSNIIRREDLTPITAQSQSQSQRSPRSSLPAADLAAEMETMAQRHDSMNDSFHLPNSPHMAWVGPSALPTMVMMPSHKAQQQIPEENTNNRKRLYCLDPSSPCKCVSTRKVFVDKKMKVHTYMTHTCTHEQDVSLFEKLKEGGFSMECAQLHSPFNEMVGGIRKYNSGCEIRFIDDRTGRMMNKLPTLVEVWSNYALNVSTNQISRQGLGLRLEISEVPPNASSNLFVISCTLQWKFSHPVKIGIIESITFSCQNIDPCFTIIPVAWKLIVQTFKKLTKQGEGEQDINLFSTKTIK